jgi:hypothetical protein
MRRKSVTPAWQMDAHLQGSAERASRRIAVADSGTVGR